MSRLENYYCIKSGSTIITYATSFPQLFHSYMREMICLIYFQSNSVNSSQFLQVWYSGLRMVKCDNVVTRRNSNIHCINSLNEYWGPERCSKTFYIPWYYKSLSSTIGHTNSCDPECEKNLQPRKAHNLLP